MDFDAPSRFKDWILKLGIRSLLKFMSARSVEQFIRMLKNSPSGEVFNPWWEVDKENDIGRNAPGIRRRQLRAYLCKRFKTARLAVIGEALGYRGGHFSGIPMTSERILLGKKKDDGIAGELKETSSANLFVIFGEPDIEIEKLKDDNVQVCVKGVDVFKPQTGEVVSDGPRRNRLLVHRH